MTTRGKVFKAYTEAIISRHGYGSSKMVPDGSPEYMKKEFARADRLMEYRIYDDICEAQKWLLDNGYIREYHHASEVNGGIIQHYTVNAYIGLTDKGWSVAKKYISTPA